MAAHIRSLRLAWKSSTTTIGTVGPTSARNERVERLLGAQPGDDAGHHRTEVVAVERAAGTELPHG
jgi:hypothetical protein